MNDVVLTECKSVSNLLQVSREERNVVNHPTIATTVYVDPNGNDSNDGSMSSPWKTLGKAARSITDNTKVIVMPGTYRNNGFGNGNNNNGVVMNLKDLHDIWVVGFSSTNKPLIEFDGSGGISMKDVYNIKISNLKIQGPNQEISIQDALADRAQRVLNMSKGQNKFSGRGIVAWSGHHIRIEDNEVSDCPNSGIRSNKGDYILIQHNKVYRNTWYSSNAESAVVIAEAVSIDQRNIYKMFISENQVFENQNKVPYFNPKYEDPAYLAANQMSIVRENYGSAAQDFILDGQGVYVTRNSESYSHGKFQLSYNTCYRNGINGLVVHKTHRALVEGNEIYDNGVTDRADRQNYAGLTLNRAAETYLRFNKVWVEDDRDMAFVRNKSEFEFWGSYDNYYCGGKRTEGGYAVGFDHWCRYLNVRISEMGENCLSDKPTN